MIVVTKKKIEKAYEDFEQIQSKERSAWGRGVCDYVFDFLYFLSEWIEHDDEVDEIKFENKAGFWVGLMNGAVTWDQYSWGGCSLIYNYDIAKRVSTPSALKASKNGERKPNAREQWLDVQARALSVAAKRLLNYALDNWKGDT